jgi:unsaturated rhamnogalacturonyl hydrolase
MNKGRLAVALACISVMSCSGVAAFGQLPEGERKASVGDAPADPGPLATDLSPALKPAAIQAAMRKVADWQNARIIDQPDQTWTFATLYVGLLAASDTLKVPTYRDTVRKVAEHYDWTLGPRKIHADDQAIGQSYLWLNREQPNPHDLEATQNQFNDLMLLPDEAAKPVWWWCDALFMAPPVWAGLAQTKHDPRYLDYMNREWQVTSDLLWDKQEKLFFRDATYFDKREKNGSKIFWSRGNGWVMGGLARVLEVLPANDPHRTFYESRLKDMAASVLKLQGSDGLWRPGLLDAGAYPYPEISGSAFFVYAMAWGIDHGLLDAKVYRPAVERGWAGLVSHIYADGRLGSIQPIGAAPGAYTPGASYVFGTGAFLLAGSEVNKLSSERGHKTK